MKITIKTNAMLYIFNDKILLYYVKSHGMFRYFLNYFFPFLNSYSDKCERITTIANLTLKSLLDVSDFCFYLLFELRN